MTDGSFFEVAHGRPRAVDAAAMRRLFGDREDLLPLWIAEPYIPLAPAVVSALEDRASEGWYGYEVRSSSLPDAFWAWMERRHDWSATGLHTSVSPSIGSSIAALIHLYSDPGDGVIIQPPVFTDFKPLITRLGRVPVRNPLDFDQGRYSMDVDHLAAEVQHPDNKIMIVCNPHNPVGRAWTQTELSLVADVCAANNVLLVSDEIHADLVLEESGFVPIAEVAGSIGVRWAATHGPIKTFGLAGVADTLLVAASDEITQAFRRFATGLHLNRNNVFSLAAAEAAYVSGDAWLDEMLAVLRQNLSILDSDLPEPLSLVASEATYLAWLDFRELGLDAPELATWLADEAALALSPGHWFGREGAGFARMTVAVEPPVMEEAVARLAAAVKS